MTYAWGYGKPSLHGAMGSLVLMPARLVVLASGGLVEPPRSSLCFFFGPLSMLLRRCGDKILHSQGQVEKRLLDPLTQAWTGVQLQPQALKLVWGPQHCFEFPGCVGGSPVSSASTVFFQSESSMRSARPVQKRLAMCTAAKALLGLGTGSCFGSVDGRWVSIAPLAYKPAFPMIRSLRIA